MLNKEYLLIKCEVLIKTAMVLFGAFSLLSFFYGFYMLVFQNDYYFGMAVGLTSLTSIIATFLLSKTLLALNKRKALIDSNKKLWPRKSIIY